MLAALEKRVWIHCQSCHKLLGRYDSELDAIVILHGTLEVEALPGSRRVCERCRSKETLQRPETVT